ncbi:MAG: ABC-type sugar transport system periplasmic component-like protein [Herbinix sp.]|jgi:ribose transport system substrate-binding protein|nr:ABC-type sugar transport system periplasmic component-like protein [Herbinix sp.]
MEKSTYGIKKNKIIFAAILLSIVTGFIIIFTGMTYYKFRISELGIEDIANYHTFKHHYAIISEEEDAPFWEAIYEGALQKGKEADAYIEKIGSNLSVSYSLYELMEIAIASQVDGIIIEPNGEDYITELINKADEADIPVITVLKDAPESKRKSFVGINSFNQGQAYSEQVLDVIRRGRKKITVLLNSDSKDNSQDLIYSHIREAVRDENVEVEAATVNTQSTFSSEEDIRDIIMDAVHMPEVLVCLTAVDTLCAYQAVVDYNKVGQIDIIGYYDSELILRAIDMNIIHSTMTIDAKQMGAYCVEALTEYMDTKRVSEYYSVDIDVIDSDNIDQYIEDDTAKE